MSQPSDEYPTPVTLAEALQATVPTFPAEGRARLHLLDQDVQSAQIALHLYRRARVFSHEHSRSGGRPAVHLGAHAAIFHHAKSFVCAMRRVARVMEGLVATRSMYPPSVAEAMRLQWRIRRAMFDSYTDPRNAIEHLDSALSGLTSYSIVNLCNDRLQVTDDVCAEVSQANLESAIKGREEILKAVKQHLL